MDALNTEIREVSPDDPAIAPIIARHLEIMYASSPACSVHAMTAEALGGKTVSLFATFDGDRAVAIGALKRLSSGHGELKSMHVVQEARGQGLARQMLAHLIEEARRQGCIRVSLETGSQEAFRPARALYGREGFDLCPPFEGYVEDPNSVFMTRTL